MRTIREVRQWAETHTLESVSREPHLRWTLERPLEIIGEALRRYRDSEPIDADSIPFIHRAVCLRNIIAHGYDVVDIEVLWDVVKNDLPPLEQAVLARLE